MRVIQLGAYPPPHGGVESNIVSIQEYLLAQNHWCRVINLSRHRREDTSRVAYPHSALDVLRMVRNWDYDIAHLHIGGTISRRLTLLGLVLCLQRSSKAVLTLHSGGWPSSEGGRNTGRYGLAGYAFRRFDKIICVNPDILAYFQRLGVAKARLRVISPFAPRSEPIEDLESMPDDGKIAGELKEFFRRHHPVLLTVGGLEPEYGLDSQITALRRIVRAHENVGLAIIGSGGLEHELRQRIAELPYGGSILLCGDVPHDLTLSAIAASDLLLRTTHYDGDAISVREAIYAGTPVIATDNGMRPDGVTLVPPSSSHALEEAILSELSIPRTLPSTDEATVVDGAALVTQEYLELLPESRQSAGPPAQGL